MSTVEAEEDLILNEELEIEPTAEIDQPANTSDIETPSTSQVEVTNEAIDNVHTQNVEKESEAGPSNVDTERKEEKEEEIVEERIKELKQFRVNSPSYQAVQV